MQLQINKSILHIIQGDITTQNSDAIVNAANSSLMGGGGVDGAIHRAGGPAILAECKQIVANQGRLPTGQAVITTAGNMPSKYVIHTVGPVYKDGNSNEAVQLAAAYQNCLILGSEKKLQSLCFPSISTGVYAYPVEKAAKIALNTIIEFSRQNDQIKTIRFVLFDDRTFSAYQNNLNRVLNPS